MAGKAITYQYEKKNIYKCVYFFFLQILNHLDMLKDNKALKKRKKALKHRFQVELYPGAKLFYLSGKITVLYMRSAFGVLLVSSSMT